MRLKRTRLSDSTFDINLAPFLDIIVAVVPLLLMSVVFVEIKMIETPVPQVVQDAMKKEDDDKSPKVTLQLKVSKKTGMALEVIQNGKTETINIPNAKTGEFDLGKLSQKAFEVKRQFPDVFRVGLAPEADVAFKDLIKIMDQLRRSGAPERKVAYVDQTSGQRVETDVMFPNLTFSNVLPGE